MVALHPDESKARRPLLKIPEILWGHNGDIFIYIYNMVYNMGYTGVKMEYMQDIMLI